MEQDIIKILTRGRKSKVTPGAVVGWIDDSSRHIVPFGSLTYDETSASVSENTLYDVASITKSIPLSSLVHIAIQEGRLSLETYAKEIVSELSGKYHELIKIEHLLTYTAIWDLPKRLSEYSHDGAEAVFDAIYNLPLQANPGEKYYYTNTPAIILGIILERIYSKRLDKLATEKLFDQIGMNHTTFDVSSTDDILVAPTEIDHGVIVHKKVHDETARTLRESLDFISGHAGIFSSASDLLNYCSMTLKGGKTEDGAQIFTSETIAAFQNNYIKSISGSVALGWELNQPRFMGKYSNEHMFGKTGFTGCIVIIDIYKQKAMVILSNTQFPRRHDNREPLNELRRNIADIVFAE